MSVQDVILWTGRPELMLEPLAGLSLLERQLFVLGRAGARRVWIASDQPLPPAGLRAPEGLRVDWVRRDGDHPLQCRVPYAVCSGDYLFRPEALRALWAAPPPGPVSYRDDEGRGVLQIVTRRGPRVLHFERRPMTRGSYARVDSAPARAAALRWLCDGVRKEQDGFMARHFDRRLSLAVTRRLLPWPVSPNYMTAVSAFIGVAACTQFLFPDRLHAAAGAAGVWLSSVLDGCDGEIARLKYQESDWGGMLDFWGDNCVHVALFLCLGFGIGSSQPGVPGPTLGAVAAGAALASALLSFRHSRLKRGSGDAGPWFTGLRVLPEGASGAARWLERLEDSLTQRDFIYLLLAAAVFQKLTWFLWASALGAPVFLLILLFLQWKASPTRTRIHARAYGSPVARPGHI